MNRSTELITGIKDYKHISISATTKRLASLLYHFLFLKIIIIYKMSIPVYKYNVIYVLNVSLLWLYQIYILLCLLLTF